MYQIEGTYQAEDYQKAIELHSFPKFMGISFHLAWFGLFIFNILASLFIFLSIDGLLAIKYFLLLIIVVMLIVSIFYYVYLPYKVKKIFAQQKEIQLPFKMEIGEGGVFIQNSMSQAARTWDMFTKWKENKNILMIYISDAAFVMLPVRLFSQESLGFARECLRKNRIPKK